MNMDFVTIMGEIPPLQKVSQHQQLRQTQQHQNQKQQHAQQQQNRQQVFSGQQQQQANLGKRTIDHLLSVKDICQQVEQQFASRDRELISLEEKLQMLNRQMKYVGKEIKDQACYLSKLSADFSYNSSKYREIESNYQAFKSQKFDKITGSIDDLPQWFTKIDNLIGEMSVDIKILESITESVKQYSDKYMRNIEIETAKAQAQSKLIEEINTLEAEMESLEQQIKESQVIANNKHDEDLVLFRKVNLLDDELENETFKFQQCSLNLETIRKDLEDTEEAGTLKVQTLETNISKCKDDANLLNLKIDEMTQLNKQNERAYDQNVSEFSKLLLQKSHIENNSVFAKRELLNQLQAEVGANNETIQGNTEAIKIIEHEIIDIRLRHDSIYYQNKDIDLKNEASSKLMTKSIDQLYEIKGKVLIANVQHENISKELTMFWSKAEASLNEEREFEKRLELEYSNVIHELATKNQYFNSIVNQLHLNLEQIQKLTKNAEAIHEDTEKENKSRENLQAAIASQKESIKRDNELKAEVDNRAKTITSLQQEQDAVNMKIAELEKSKAYYESQCSSDGRIARDEEFLLANEAEISSRVQEIWGPIEYEHVSKFDKDRNYYLENIKALDERKIKEDNRLQAKSEKIAELKKQSIALELQHSRLPPTAPLAARGDTVANVVSSSDGVRDLAAWDPYGQAPTQATANIAHARPVTTAPPAAANIETATTSTATAAQHKFQKPVNKSSSAVHNSHGGGGVSHSNGHGNGSSSSHYDTGSKQSTSSGGKLAAKIATADENAGRVVKGGKQTTYAPSDREGKSSKSSMSWFSEDEWLT